MDLRRARQSGFSLIEVIVALGILAVGISTTIALFAAATAAHSRAIDRFHIATIAEHALADIESALMRGESPETVVKDPPFAEIEKNYPGYGVTPVFYEIADGTSDELLLELRISWRSRGADREEIFRQIVTRQLLVR